MIVTTTPFPHIVTGDLFDHGLLQACFDEIPSSDETGWRRYGNDHERKLEGPPHMWGLATQEYFAELEALAEDIADAFGLPDLYLETIGGGYHLIPPGGYLGVHTDFSRSPVSGRYRRLNVLTYLNRDWKLADGGLLELWNATEPEHVIAPEFGTTVIFETSATSWHGHPVPTTRWRASLAGYFFTDEPPAGYVPQSTVWHPNA